MDREDTVEIVDRVREDKIAIGKEKWRLEVVATSQPCLIERERERESSVKCEDLREGG